MIMPRVITAQGCSGLMAAESKVLSVIKLFLLKEVGTEEIMSVHGEKIVCTVFDGDSSRRNIATEGLELR